MGRLAKRSLVVVLVLGVVAGGVAVMISDTFSSGHVKSRIADWVERRTGRQLIIQGGVSLTFYPWLGFKIADVAFANDPLFGPEPMAEVEEISVRVKLLPLLQRRLEVDQIALRGAYLNLVRDRNGRGNWVGIEERLSSRKGDSQAPPSHSLLEQTPTVTPVEPTTAANPAAREATTDGKAGSGDPGGSGAPARAGAVSPLLAALAIDGIEITNTSLRFQDDLTGNSLALEEFNLRSGAIRVGQPVQGSIETEWSLANPELAGSFALSATIVWDPGREEARARGVQVRLSLSGGDLPLVENLQGVLRADLQADPRQHLLRIDQGTLQIDAQGGGMPTGGLNVKLSGDGVFDWAAETLRMTDWRATLFDQVRMRGTLEGRGLLHTPKLTSSLVVAEFAPRSLLPHLGYASLVFHDPKVMQVAAFEGTVQVDPDRLAITGIKGRLDDTRLTGDGRVDHGQKPVMHIDLQLDQMDVDRYQADHARVVEADRGKGPSGHDDAKATAAGAPARDGAKPDAKAQRGGEVEGGGDDPDEERDAYDSEQSDASSTAVPQSAAPAFLAKGEVRGKVSAERFKIRGVTLEKVALNVATAGETVKVEPLQARVYGGALTTQAWLELHDPEPLLHLDDLTLKGIDIGQLLRESGHPQPVSGRADGQARLVVRLLPGEAWRNTLDGTARVVVHDGALEGIDLEHRVLAAYAAFKQRSPETLPADRGKTPFNELSASARVHEGVADNQDLKAASGLLALQGAGRFDLTRQQMDYGIKVRMLPVLEGVDHTAKDLQGLDVPVRLVGEFRQPVVQVDLAGLLSSALRTKAVEKIGGRLGEKLREPKVQEGVRKLEKQLGAPLKKLLPF
ncbi:MAG: AsmA family protein [Magnetococcales bacterium]|nr:AsmA family protein [Magnetococcales bacterium]